MASSENLAASIDPWVFRPTINDCWFSELFARDTETLTKALQKSLEPVVAVPPPSDAAAVAAAAVMSPFAADIFRPEPVQTPTPTVSGVSGSDPDTPSSVAAAAPKRQRSAIPPGVAGGKVSKRKSRATKRSQTTFITADPANFRQMVQQVTGVRFGGVAAPFGTAPIVKPEPQRACSGPRFPVAVACLPTLDTSALLLDHHNSSNSNINHQTPVGSMTAMTSLGGGGAGSVPAISSFVETGGSGGLDFTSFPSFPTLESWKVM